MKKAQETEKMRQALLDWYDRSGRSLPWRIRPEERAAGKTPNPYAVWLSEIMLQQTTVAHATPYWHRFLDEFPTVIDLANAPRDRVLTLWAGLGYYARARNLHKCAQTVRDDFGGLFPVTEEILLSLPGIGAYTAATMAAICANEPTNIVDGNVERVISRIFQVQTPLPKGKQDIRKLAATLACPDRPGDYGQALMDLGATVCAVRNPQCTDCIWAAHCAANKDGSQTDYPRKTKKKKQPIRYGAVFVLESEGDVLLERRPDEGLLGGMMGFPGTEWGVPPNDPLQSAPVQHNWRKLDGNVRHIFTHFDLRLDVYVASVSRPGRVKGYWQSGDAMDAVALPTVMRKVYQLILRSEP